MLFLLGSVLTLLSIGLPAPVAPLPPEPLGVVKSSGVLDPERDSRLRQKVTITADQTTVGAVLRELARVTGVPLRAGSPEVEDEPIILIVRERPLHSALRLIADLFHWGPERKYGWAWMARERGKRREYTLQVDLPTRRLPAEMRLRDRQWFGEELERVRVAAEGDPITRGVSVPALRILRTLPPEAIRQVLQGRQAILPWDALPTATQAGMARALGEPVEEGEQKPWVEVRVTGEGPTLGISVMYRSPDGGGSGFGTALPSYYRRWQAATGIKLGSISLNGNYEGAAAIPIHLDAAGKKAWREPGRLTTLLELLSRAAQRDLLCDDYGYGYNWRMFFGRDGRVPEGEPLGFWLNALSGGAHVVRNRGEAPLEWRESEGAFQLRNRKWYSEDAMRPPLQTRFWLRELIRQGRPGRPKVLTLPEAFRLFRAVPAGSTQWSALLGYGYLRRGNDVLEDPGQRGLFLFLSLLDPAQMRRVFSAEGLRISDLRPEQRERLTRVGPDQTDVFVSARSLQSSWGGDLGTSLRWDGHSLHRTYRPLRGKVSESRIDMRLPDPTYEVCTVTVAAEKPERAAPP